MLSLSDFHFPDDITIKFFSRLSLTELNQSGKVCKLWYDLSKNNELWILFYKELNPFEKNLIFEKNKIKEIVVLELQKHEIEAYKIVNLINDYTIAAMFCSSISLNNLKKKPLDCCFYVMSTVRKDCTKLYSKMAEIFDSYLKNKTHYSDYDNHPLNLLNHLFEACHDNNYRKNPDYVNLLNENMIKAKKSSEIFLNLKNSQSLEGTYFD
jgi:hypothetical protein